MAVDWAGLEVTQHGKSHKALWLGAARLEIEGRPELVIVQTDYLNALEALQKEQS